MAACCNQRLIVSTVVPGIVAVLALEFYRAQEIFDQRESARDQLKQQLQQLLQHG